MLLDFGRVGCSGFRATNNEPGTQSISTHTDCSPKPQDPPNSCWANARTKKNVAIGRYTLGKLGLRV